jgi:sucrose phosphorylase
VLSQLKDPETFRSRIFYNYIKMIKTRKRQSAFHPNSDFEILEIDPKVFVIARYAKDQIIYAVTNISSKRMVVSLSGASAPLWMKDLITGVSFRTDALKLNPYQFLWLSTMDR